MKPVKAGLAKILELGSVILLYRVGGPLLDKVLPANLKKWELIASEALSWLLALVIVVLLENLLLGRPHLKATWTQQNIPIEATQILRNRDEGSVLFHEVNFAYSAKSLFAIVATQVIRHCQMELLIEFSPAGIARLRRDWSTGIVKFSPYCISLTLPKVLANGPLASSRVRIEPVNSKAVGTVSCRARATSPTIRGRALNLILKKSCTIQSVQVIEGA